MVTVLRLGHRLSRDRRVSTHLALVARAFGATRMLMTCRDERLERSVARVCESWGGEFRIEVVENWRTFLRRWRGVRVHLTMYGEHVDDRIQEIRSAGGELLVIVGAEKVPAEVFELADYNVAIGHQPHSEVAALAVFLDRYFEGRELHRDFGGKLRVVPMARGKRVEER